MAHGDITRWEWRVTCRSTIGTLYVEWASSERRVEQLRELREVVKVEWAEHVLDY